MPPPGQIILLNGTSSAGKSSIVRALQALMPQPYLDAGLDRFLWMLPGRYLDDPLWQEVLGQATQAGPAGLTLVSGMHQAIAALARAGNHVVADHVLVEPRWLHECARLFSELPAWLVGVHCPLAVLQQREQARANRTLGQAARQLPLVHAHAIYDLELDTSQLSPQACARQIRHMVQLGEPHAFRQLRARLPAQ